MLKPYYETPNGRLYCGACKNIMDALDSNSIDTIITDPPYGLNFMGKKWDYDVPSVKTFSLMLDVVKPGATMFCFAGSRTQHRMAVNIEDAGWILKDCIMWLYATGFPKATNISRQLDKGHIRKVIGQNQDILTKQAKDLREKKRIIKDSFDKGASNRNNGFVTVSADITEPATPEAKLWNGWKSHGLKPAYEPILVCMKPNEGSYAENALKHGVAGLNIDGGRIEYQETGEDPRLGGKGSWKPKRVPDGHTFSPKAKELKTSSQGRYPANIILDEEAGRLLDLQSGDLKSGALLKHHNQSESENNCMSGKNYKRNPTKDFAVSQGGASRFFYCAKASKSERNAGLYGNSKKRDESRSHGQAGTDNPYNRGAQEVINFHPTVKPLKLIEYLYPENSI